MKLIVACALGFMAARLSLYWKLDLTTFLSLSMLSYAAGTLTGLFIKEMK